VKFDDAMGRIVSRNVSLLKGEGRREEGGETYPYRARAWKTKADLRSVRFFEVIRLTSHHVHSN